MCIRDRLYFGLMLTQDGPKVVEYNARFGDPETQPILSMLDTDLMDIFQACVNGTLDQVDIRWKEGAACCIVLASGGYPVQYQSGYPISGLEEAGKLATVFHAGTDVYKRQPLPSFEGEPRKVAVTAPDAKTLANELWASLNEDNKVSLFVQYVDLASGERDTVIINKHQ